MKILLVILHADPSRGGAERYTIDLANALQAGGHDISIAAQTFSVPARSFQQVSLPARGLTRSRVYKAFLDDLDNHLAGTKYDIVHAMLPVRLCDLYHPHAGIAGNLPGGIGTLINPRRRVFAQVEDVLLGSSDPPVVLSLSSYIDAQAKRAYPGHALRLERLMNAVDLCRFNPDSVESVALDAMGPIALIVAQDFDRKGVGPAIHAVNQIAGLTLLVVGGDNAAPYRSRGGSVIFAGATPDPRPYYKRADLFVLPTRHDPCSLVVLEALAMGLPVITTKQNGASDVMTPGVHGYVLDSGDDIPALTAAMKSVL
ncbi:MAG: glycosyltransferase family 4 protein, partial [Burkholderiales bacterium]|nr:glycosyltransferase family 4 protein [Phycisphaerae bacterium]